MKKKNLFIIAEIGAKIWINQPNNKINKRC